MPNGSMPSLTFFVKPAMPKRRELRLFGQLSRSFTRCSPGARARKSSSSSSTGRRSASSRPSTGHRGCHSPDVWVAGAARCRRRHDSVRPAAQYLLPVSLSAAQLRHSSLARCGSLIERPAAFQHVPRRTECSSRPRSVFRVQRHTAIRDRPRPCTQRWMTTSLGGTGFRFWPRLIFRRWRKHWRKDAPPKIRSTCNNAVLGFNARVAPTALTFQQPARAGRSPAGRT